MRNLYYQSVDNPVQIDRLPTTRPEVTLLAPSPSRVERLDVMLGLALIAAAVVSLADQGPIESRCAWLQFGRCPGFSGLPCEP